METKAEVTRGRKILKLKRISLRSKNRKIQNPKLRTSIIKMKSARKFDAKAKNKDRNHNMLNNHIKITIKPKKVKMSKAKHYPGHNQLLSKYINYPSKTNLDDDKKSRPQLFQFAKSK